MPLTLSWWTERKNHNDNKVDGRVAPETDFERHLKTYDTARKTLDSKVAIDKSQRALDELERSRSASMNALNAAGFKKLGAECGPNSGRLLNNLVTAEKTAIQTAKREVEARMKLGPAQMQNLGPGAGMRKRHFDIVVAAIKQLNDGIRRSPQMTKEQIATYLAHLNATEKDVTLYCKDKPGAQAFQTDFTGCVTELKGIQTSWGDKRVLAQNMVSVGQRLTRLVNSQYVA